MVVSQEQQHIVILEPPGGENILTNFTHMGILFVGMAQETYAIRYFPNQQRSVGTHIL